VLQLINDANENEFKRAPRVNLDSRVDDDKFDCKLILEISVESLSACPRWQVWEWLMRNDSPHHLLQEGVIHYALLVGID
jgi:hypothetical protein